VRQVEGFMLGARYANPNIQTYQSYINSWDDVGKAKEAAQAQIDSGADVILGATDQASRGIFSAAQNAGVYAIASYADQASLAPKTILASVLYDFSSLVKDMVVNAANGKLESGKTYVLGLANGFGSLALNPAMDAVIPAKTKEKVAAVTKEIEAGRLKIPFDLIKPGQASGISLDSLRLR
jgi:basic membrane protein A